MSSDNLEARDMELAAKRILRRSLAELGVSPANIEAIVEGEDWSRAAHVISGRKCSVGEAEFALSSLRDL